MDIEAFLSRVVGPGNYLATNWKKPANDWMASQFFKHDDIGRAANYLRWASKSGNDAYFALAGYDVAHADGVDKHGNEKLKGERKQSNAYALRCFWIDVDVKREGDKKGANVYATRRDAVVWLQQFLNATNLPAPNLRVDSGYGFHWYWILEDAMARDDWQPYADALKHAMQANGFKCEAGLSNDAARILRPPETMNCKGGTQVPVRVMTGSRGDYPNDLILTKLETWRGAAPIAQATQAGLAGAGPAAAFAGAAQPNMAAAAQANVQRARDRSFDLISRKCEQVKQSLTAGGNGDPYQLWYLGHLSLAHHCADGDKFVHEISKGDPRYSAQQVDDYVARIAAEKAVKDRGPPRCGSFDGWRPGVCQGCAFNGKLTSPWVLGVEADDADLPKGYRRANNALQLWVERADGASMWLPFVDGDVYAPVLDRTAKGYLLTFTYECAGHRFAVRALEPEIPTDASGNRGYFAPQHISLDRLKAPMFGDFVSAWIRTLRQQNAERTEVVKPFGYAVDVNGDHVGMAVGGTLYRSDGTTEAAPGADAGLTAGFKPSGTYAKWREAFDLVCTGRPDLQLIVSAAFGAPLMRMTGQKGLVVSAWSQQSGVGKSAAMRVGQTVWSAPRFMTSLQDTPNAINDKIASTQYMPCFWDEMRVGREDVSTMVNALFTIAQGKEKNRLRSDITHREVREWETLVMVAGNAPLMDHVVSQVATTDAGAVRLLEFNIAVPSLKGTAQAARIIQQVDHSYGHAGRMFIEYVTAHHAEVKKLVGDMSDALERDLGSVGEERMYIAGMASLLVGARIANGHGIAAFDLKAMYALLKHTFTLSRTDRKADLVTNNGAADVEQILALFNSDYMGNRLITNRFAKQGPNKGVFKVEWTPSQQGRAEVHIAVDDKMMRINRTTFAGWCRKRGLNATDVFRQMEARLLAVKDKGVIGGGTVFAGGRITVIDVPLNDPSMTSYLVVPEPAQTSALATPPTPGNQPKV